MINDGDPYPFNGKYFYPTNLDVNALTEMTLREKRGDVSEIVFISGFQSVDLLEKFRRDLQFKPEYEKAILDRKTGISYHGENLTLTYHVVSPDRFE